jgi:hypothetical protein
MRRFEMSNRSKVTIGVIVAAIVVVGIGLLGLGEAIYRKSDGERGWSLGAGVYELFGWDADAYRSDFGRGGMARGGEAELLDLPLVDEDGDGVPDRVQVPEEAAFGRGFGSRFDRSRHPFGVVGRLFCWGFFALVIGAGFVLYRRRRNRAHS